MSFFNMFLIIISAVSGIIAIISFIDVNRNSSSKIAILIVTIIVVSFSVFVIMSPSDDTDLQPVIPPEGTGDSDNGLDDVPLDIPTDTPIIEDNSLSLLESDPFAIGDGVQLNYRTRSEDNYGNTYQTNVSAIPPFHSDDIEDVTVEYFLDSKYSQMTGVLYVDKDGAQGDGHTHQWEEATVYIYGDGELLYYKNGFVYDTEPENLMIDVQNIDRIKISFVNTFYINTGSGKSLVLIGDLFVE